MAQLSRLVAVLCVLVAASLTCQLFMIFTRETVIQPFADMGTGLTPSEREALIRRAAVARGWAAEVEVYRQDAEVEHQAAAGLNQAEVKEGFKHQSVVAFGREDGLEGLEQPSAAGLKRTFGEEGELDDFKRQAMSRQMLGENAESAPYVQQHRKTAISNEIARDRFSNSSRKVDPNLSYRLDKIEKVLKDLLARGDNDIVGLPVMVLVSCGEGEERVRGVGDGGKLQVCIDKLLVLEYIRDSTALFEDATVFDLKFALVGSLVETVSDSMLEVQTRQSQSFGDGEGAGGKKSLSRDVLLQVHRSTLEALTADRTRLDSRELHPDRRNRLFKTDNSYGQDFEVGFVEQKGGVGGGADINDWEGLHKEQIGGQHMGEGGEPAKQVLPFKAEGVDERHREEGGDPVKQVLQFQGDPDKEMGEQRRAEEDDPVKRVLQFKDSDELGQEQERNQRVEQGRAPVQQVLQGENHFVGMGKEQVQQPIQQVEQPIQQVEQPIQQVQQPIQQVEQPIQQVQQPIQQVEQPIQQVMQRVDEVGGKQAAESVQQVLQSNEVVVVGDGAGGGSDNEGKGGGGLVELEQILPPPDESSEDEKEYELENASPGAVVGVDVRHSEAGGVSQHQNGPDRQGPPIKPARPNRLGSDYDAGAAIGPNRNARNNPFFPPSNPVFGGGAGGVQAIRNNEFSPPPGNPVPQKGGVNIQKSPSAPLPEGNGAGKESVGRKPAGQRRGKKDKKSHSRKFLLSPELYQLIGSQSPRYSSLQERGFAERHDFNSNDLQSRSKCVQEVVRALERNLWDDAVKSLNRDLVERGKFQRYQTDQFCGRNRMPKVFPSKMEELDSLFKHLLYDDSKKIVVCYVPKNGCSNLKRMMLVLNGILPPASSSNPYKRPSEDILGSVHSFRNLTREQAIYKLKNYYKFAIVRNPLERLLSAYKNKLETPLNATMRKKFPDRLKAYLLDLYAHDQLKSWISARQYTKDIHPTFQHLLKFMTQFSLSSYNEHFMPFVQLCFPCAVDYDLLINFKTINYDMYALMDYLNIPPSYYPAAIGHETPTSAYMKQYYGNISGPIKEDLFKKLEQELDFYYALQPEEEGMHRDL